MANMPTGKSDIIGRLRYWEREIERLNKVKFPSETQEARLAIARAYVKEMSAYIDGALTSRQDGLF